MESHLWFQQLRKALREQRVPIAYANRLIDELWLHYLETKEQDEMNGFHGTDSKLTERFGSPDTLAIQAVKVTRTTWVGRHPWLTFVFGTPLMAFALILSSVLLSAFLLLPFIKGKNVESDPWLETAAQVAGPLQVVVPAVLGCLVMFRLVRRSYSHPIWGVVSSGLIAVVCMCTYITWSAPTSIPLSGKLSLGFGTPSLLTMAQAFIPTLIVAIYAWRNLRPLKAIVQDTAESQERAAA